MNKYVCPAEAELDLHGCTCNEAKIEVEIFLAECRAENFHKIRLITGKGLHSENQVATMREYVKRILEMHDLPYEYAKYNEGGEGVLEVWLS